MTTYEEILANDVHHAIAARLLNGQSVAAIAEALVTLYFTGRPEAQVKAEAIREAADACGTGDPYVDEDWRADLRSYADRIERV